MTFAPFSASKSFLLFPDSPACLICVWTGHWMCTERDETQAWVVRKHTSREVTGCNMRFFYDKTYDLKKLARRTLFMFS